MRIYKEAMKHLSKVLLFASLAGTGAAQAPPADLSATMQTIAAALGVSCGYCHTAERGSGQPEPKKDIARAMMAMTRDINSKIQAVSPSAATVECVTCHRGVAVPRQLSDVVSQTMKEKGVAAAMTEYRDLRKQYYGRQAYDFGDGVLVSIAQRISNSKPDDAIALLNLNLEFNPRSAATYAAIAFAYTRKLDDDSAIQNLEKALEIEPENGIVRGQLEQLKSYQRARQKR
jgi:tetratricopeptide (TPR) repeat protein